MPPAGFQPISPVPGLYYPPQRHSGLVLAAGAALCGGTHAGSWGITHQSAQAFWFLTYLLVLEALPQPYPIPRPSTRDSNVDLEVNDAVDTREVCICVWGTCQISLRLSFVSCALCEVLHFIIVFLFQMNKQVTSPPVDSGNDNQALP